MSGPVPSEHRPTERLAPTTPPVDYAAAIRLHRTQGPAITLVLDLDGVEDVNGRGRFDGERRAQALAEPRRGSAAGYVVDIPADPAVDAAPTGNVPVPPTAAAALYSAVERGFAPTYDRIARPCYTVVLIKVLRRAIQMD